MAHHTAASRHVRRWFFARLSALAGAAGAGIIAAGQGVSAQSDARPFRPSQHEQDAWLDRVPGRHRAVFDTTDAGGFGESLVFANNFLIASKNGYGLADSDNAIVIVARHLSTVFAYNDTLWAKYGTHFAKLAGESLKTRQTPSVNPFNTTAPELGTRGVTVNALTARGVHWAVCQMATQFFSGQIAEATGAKAEAVFEEIAANLIANAHLAAAGIVAVNRAQERGYTLTTAV